MVDCKEIDYKKEYSNAIGTINELKEQLADKDKEIAELKKDIRHQVCEEIRDWYREQDLIIEVWLKDCLNQIEGDL